MSIGRLQLLGESTDATPMRPQNPRQAVFLHEITRTVTVPPELAAPDAWFCTVVDHESSAACLKRPSVGPPASRQATYVGAYEPYPYVLMGLATRLAGDPVGALLWARLANLLVALAFTIAGLWLLWDRFETTSLVGFVLAATPMVVFTSAVVSPSGAEVGASICVIAAIIRLWRRPGDAAAATALGISGFVLAISRPLGPVWLVFDVLLLACLIGVAGLRQVYEASPARTWGFAALVGIGAGLNVAWQVVVLPPGARSLGDIASFLGPSLVAQPEALGEAIGVFGWQDTLMPRPVYGVWGVALVALIAAGLLTGRRREVRMIEFTLLATGVLAVGLSAVAIMPTGFAAQGRYVLPALVTVPILAGEVAHRNWRRRHASWVPMLTGGLVVVAGLVQFVAWYSNARRYAVGTRGSWLFLGRALWEPPLGWAPWLGLAFVGAAVIVLTPVVARHPLRSPASSPLSCQE